jgi:drug/metabolite transporter (DMT)-like permease
MLWMIFYGRRRRGFPWLLLAVLVVVGALALVFAIPGGADVSRTLAALLVALVLAGAVVAAIVAVFFPRRRG